MLADKLWDWAKEFLNRGELKNKLLLAIDKNEKTAFHQALFRDNIRILEEYGSGLMATDTRGIKEINFNPR